MSIKIKVGSGTCSMNLINIRRILMRCRYQPAYNIHTKYVIIITYNRQPHNIDTLSGAFVGHPHFLVIYKSF